MVLHLKLGFSLSKNSLTTTIWKLFHCRVKDVEFSARWTGVPWIPWGKQVISLSLLSGILLYFSPQDFPSIRCLRGFFPGHIKIWPTQISRKFSVSVFVLGMSVRISPIHYHTLQGDTYIALSGRGLGNRNCWRPLPYKLTLGCSHCYHVHVEGNERRKIELCEKVGYKVTCHQGYQPITTLH